MKKILAMLLALMMVLSMTACGGSSAPAEAPAAEDPEAEVPAKTFTVGICQLVPHVALDAATQGFKDALTEKLGDKVKIASMGLTGIVNALPDNKGNMFIQCGIMRTKANIADLVLVEEEEITSKAIQRTGAGKIKMSKSFQVSPEINLLGQTVDEALATLDKYLDDAYLAHLPSVRVVHGKGTGALRQGVHNYLRRSTYVESYRLGEIGEGDAGVTIVTFKK